MRKGNWLSYQASQAKKDIDQWPQWQKETMCMDGAIDSDLETNNLRDDDTLLQKNLDISAQSRQLDG